MSAAVALTPAEKEKHAWFEKRRDILAGELDRLVPDIERPEILDAGCGAGMMLEDLAGRGRVTGVDADPAAVAAARARGRGDVQLARVESLPFEDGRFDLITCLDVLEHAGDDAVALAELRRVARPGARLLVTVPALPWLWSPHDVAAGHRRRYRRGALLSVARRSGWEPLELKSFNTLLLPLMVPVRLAARARRGSARSDLLTAPALAERLLRPALTAETALMRRGLRLPVGLSLLATFETARREP